MADNDQLREFLEEIQVMKAVGSHKNIVNMVGCCTIGDPIFLLTEYVPYGDLLHYLRKRRGKVRSKSFWSKMLLHLRTRMFDRLVAHFKLYDNQSSTDLSKRLKQFKSSLLPKGHFVKTISSLGAGMALW